MKTGTAAYLGITTGLMMPAFSEDPVISLGADTDKAFSFEDGRQLLVRDGAKLWHASEEAVDSSAPR